jgi:quinoprotein glucose dehydrogenase
LAPQTLEPDQVYGATPADRAACRAIVAGATGHNIFSPPSLKGVVATPGNLGGPNWSGFSFDPTRNLLLVNTNNLPAFIRLVPPDQLEAADKANTHGDVSPQRGAPYGMLRRFLFAGPSDSPCAKPPWGELLAVDLAKGAIRWRRPLGSMTEINPALNDESFGAITLGGTITTGGGLTFIGGTTDRRFRAFDTDTGKAMWSTELPASAHATPMTFQFRGRQYVVIAAGGHAALSEERRGDSILAFALPPQ